MHEEEKYKAIKHLVEEGGSKERAALILGITRRQVNRLIQKYQELGKAAFVHGNRGRKPATTIPETRRQEIVDLYQTKYYDSNFAHFTEILARDEGIHETRYANDIEDVVAEIRGEETMNRTVNAAFFSASRLLSLQTRNSAAYKGIMALIYKEDSKDFVRGTTMDVIRSVEDTPDIHHIFPEAYCIRKKYPKEKWNSIVNKTPLLPASNRQIGGDAPSVYSKRIKTKARIDEAKYRSRIESHLIDYSSFIRDDFDTYFILRAKALLRIIESAMGKKVPDRASEQTIKAFGEALEENEPAVSAE